MLLNKLWFVINYVRECTVNIFFFQTIHAHLSYQFFLLLYCFWNQRKYKRISTEFLLEIDFFSLFFFFVIIFFYLYQFVRFHWPILPSLSSDSSFNNTLHNVDTIVMGFWKLEVTIWYLVGWNAGAIDRSKKYGFEWVSVLTI